ncbi:uncharacterized protein STEHIDRAFT_126294 [Stereum hirsutum FP-91666 SS1]|uniref:Uncharacterized protein n=1 Tax=Stereum hirsutum (strain FP-91666) TaxID=721885 RepID=R7S0H2_STEHR|nr:uncharacterized protein STEHIDRAFT_126294 [Stereum hirsutum FP-91666 SS1]EIM80037.1 hypothetical protein STEHIDRAFT_126294 [Stereum hirsutum FP-91666 SS1]
MWERKLVVWESGEVKGRALLASVAIAQTDGIVTAVPARTEITHKKWCAVFVEVA